MKKCIYPILFLLFALFSCEKEETKPDTNQYEKITKILLNSNPMSNSFMKNDSTLFVNSFIIDFNKNDYSDVDSIKFVLVDFNNKSGKPISVSLYNTTDAKVINNSALTILGLPRGNRISGNIINEFPDKPINIGIQMIMSPKMSNVDFNCTAMYLYLYRKVN
jgi:hypothetical protein